MEVKTKKWILICGNKTYHLTVMRFLFDEMLMNGSKNTAGGFQDSIRDSKILLNAPRLTSEAFIILLDATCCSKDAT